MDIFSTWSWPDNFGWKLWHGTSPLATFVPCINVSTYKVGAQNVSGLPPAHTSSEQGKSKLESYGAPN